MNRIFTFMALSVWLAFGLAFKLVSDMTRTPKAPAHTTAAADQNDLAEAKRRRLDDFQKRLQTTPPASVGEQTAFLK